MNHLQRSILLTVLALSAAGCATMNKSECRTADWQMIGYEDGAVGRELGYIGNHRKACAEHGVKPNMARYRAGHAEGIAAFCTERNGFQQGRAGRAYNGVCPAASEERFLVAWETGRELHQLDAELRRLRQDLAARRDELASMEQRSANIEKLLVSGALSANERQVQVDQFKDLQTDMATLESHIIDLERAERRAQRDYDYLDSRHPY